jgi:2-polyprenyl-3-methyl-5-hydroxy-6-metoxy-1,4-benzoquinol methylase
MKQTYGADKWNERYSVQQYVYGIKPNEFLKNKVKSIPGKDVLCVADGEGRNGVWLSTQGFKVTSIDFSSEALDKIHRLAELSNTSVNTFQADLLEYSYGSKQYDAIVSIYSHFNYEEILLLHKKYSAALKTGGIIIFEAFAKNQLRYDSGGPKDVELLYDSESLVESFPSLCVRMINESIVNLDEGDLHQGNAAVIRAIFEKP